MYRQGWMARVALWLWVANWSALAADDIGATDPFDGQWKLDTARSRITSRDRPADMLITLRTVGECLDYSSESISSSGRISRTHYTASYDGTPALVTGTFALLIPVSLKRLDSNTVEASYVRGFQVIATSRRVISEQGNLMTVTTISKVPADKDIPDVRVFVRTQPKPVPSDAH